MKSSTEAIQPGSAVKLHFSLALSSGEVIDSNFETRPAEFRHGDGNMLAGFEQRLLGLKAGDEREFVIPAAEAFGESNPRNVQHFPRTRFEHLMADDLVATETGTVVTFKDPGGFDLPGVVTDITASQVIVDFNHPLAGRDIVFRVRVMRVLPPEVATIEVKL